MKFFYWNILFFHLLVILPFCVMSQDRAALPQDTITRIGLSVITARDLLERLELMPFPQKEKPIQHDSTKLRTLLGLIAEKVLANEGRRLNLSENSDMRRMREGLEDLFIRDELFKREVVQKVKPTKKEINTGLQCFAIEQRVIAFMTSTEAECKIIASQLRKRIDIDSLIRTLSIQGIDTITITYGTMEPEVEKVIYSIDKSRISSPFFTPQSGWVLFYLLNKHPNPSAQKMDITSRRSYVEKIIRSRKYRERGEKYSFEILKSKHAVADSNVFNLLADSIVAIWKTNATYFHRNGVYLLSSDMVDILLDLFATRLDTILVTSDECNLNLGQVLEMFRYENFSSPFLEGMQYKIYLNESIKGIVAKKLLALEGRKQNLQNSLAVQQDMRRWTDYWAQGILYYNVRDSVTINEEDIIQYLIDNKNIFGNSYEVNIREVLCASLNDANEIVLKLQQGESFDSLAFKFSKRNEWAKNCGESGFFKLSEHPDIGFHAFNSDTGKLIGPLKLSEGYSLFTVLAKRYAKEKTISFDSLKQSIRTRVLHEKQKRTMDKYIAQLAREQNVSIDYEKLKNIKTSSIQMFTRRYIGFGGTMTAVPLLRFQWDWIKEYQKSTAIVP